MQLASGEAAAFFWIGGTRENKMVSMCNNEKTAARLFWGELGKALPIVMVYIECIGRLFLGGTLGNYKEGICEIIILDVAELSEPIALIEDVCLSGMGIM